MSTQQWPDAYLAKCVAWLDHGGSYADLASICGMTPEAVRNRIKRYRLRPRLSQDSLVEAWADLRTVPDPEPSAEVYDCSREPLLLGCISDTHCGSKHFAADALERFIDHAYRRGVRHVVHAGDLLAGYHKKWRTELLCSSMDDQTDVAISSLPERDGLTYYAISGNHDLRFNQNAGVMPSSYWRNRFAEAGRSDVLFVGDNRATVNVAGYRIGLQHPGSGGAENLESSVYRYLRKTPDWHGLDLYFCGHWHRYARAARFGKWCWSLPCFEHGGSAWGRGLAGDTDLGGLIVEIEPGSRQLTVREELVLYE